MTILLTTGTGKTSLAILPHLQNSQTPYLQTTRRPTAPNHVHFDWSDPATHDNPFNHPIALASPITAIYLVLPHTGDASEIVNGFVNQAIEKWGVKRFVMMCGSHVESGNPGGDAGDPGLVWEHLVQRGAGWGVLRCTWFMGSSSFYFIYLPLSVISLLARHEG